MKKRVPQWLLAALVVGACAHEAEGEVVERAQVGAPTVDCDAMTPSDADTEPPRDDDTDVVDAGSPVRDSDAGIVIMRDADVVLEPDPGEPDPGERDPDCDFITYESFGQAFFTSYCADCHSGASAPEGIDLSTLEGIQEHKEEIAEHALGMPTHNPMPPPALPQPAPEMKDMLAKFLKCGPN